MRRMVACHVFNESYMPTSKRWQCDVRCRKARRARTRCFPLAGTPRKLRSSTVIQSHAVRVFETGSVIAFVDDWVGLETARFVCLSGVFSG